MSLLIAFVLVPLVAAHDNGMDMSMDGAMDLDMGQMLTYLHFTPGDMLWFLGWVPRSTGAMIGTCIGLFLLSIVERWTACCSAVMQAHWAKRAQILHSNQLNTKELPLSSSPTFSADSIKATSISAVLRDAVTLRNGPPFIASHDILRGVIYAGRVALLYALMLAVMTYQVGFILSIVVGRGVGEVLFGRYISSAAHLG
ncbi:CTR copper uptake transporter [Cytidiella melzeri]|nr:CTR copper uptake transporter [Cytidiella melzeri]